jgi:hypothetical protein
MSGPDWKSYLSGGTSQYNFSYRNNTVTPPEPLATATTPMTPMTPSPVLKQIPVTKSKKNQTGGKRKRKHLKRKTIKK